MPGLIETRLRHQGLTGTPRKTAREVVAWLGAVQAQDYPGAAWALALRTRVLTLADVDRALADGEIIRTHVLRPTWHFVTPADLRWMLALTGPRIKRLMTTYDARLELDARTYTRARVAFERALAGRPPPDADGAGDGAGAGKDRGHGSAAGASGDARRTRRSHLQRPASGARSSPTRWWTNTCRRRRRSHATRRWQRLPRAISAVMGRPPCTTSRGGRGLTVGDSRAAVALADVEDAVLPAPPAADRVTGAHYLLPNYDEFLIAYRHRDAVLDPERSRNFGVFTSAEYPHQIVLHGRVAGSWRREVTATGAQLTLKTYAPASKSEAKALAGEAARLGRFFGVPCAVRD